MLHQRCNIEIPKVQHSCAFFVTILSDDYFDGEGCEGKRLPLTLSLTLLLLEYQYVATQGEGVRVK